MALNIAEGAGEFSPADKARLYRIARRSATECAAILDICERLELASGDQLASGHAILKATVFPNGAWFWMGIGFPLMGCTLPVPPEGVVG